MQGGGAVVTVGGGGGRPRWRLSDAELRKTYSSYQSLVDKDCARFAGPTPREAAFLRGGVLDDRTRLAARARAVNQAFFDALIAGVNSDGAAAAAATPLPATGDEAAGAASAASPAAGQPLEIRDFPGVKVRAAWRRAPTASERPRRLHGACDRIPPACGRSAAAAQGRRLGGRRGGDPAPRTPRAGGGQVGSESYSSTSSIMLHLFRDWSPACDHVAAAVYRPIVAELQARPRRGPGRAWPRGRGGGGSSEPAREHKAPGPVRRPAGAARGSARRARPGRRR